MPSNSLGRKPFLVAFWKRFRTTGTLRARKLEAWTVPVSPPSHPRRIDVSTVQAPLAGCETATCLRQVEAGFGRVWEDACLTCFPRSLRETFRGELAQFPTLPKVMLASGDLE